MKKLLFAFSISIFIVISCSEDLPYVNEDVPATINGNITELFKDLQPPIETFNADSDDEIRLISDSRTVYCFPKEAFETLDGTPVSGNVDIEITEMYTKSSIIMYGIHTESNGQILESDGEFNIEASKDGQALQLRDGLRFKIQKQDDDPDPRMLLFEGSEDGTTWDLASPDSTGVQRSEWFIDSTAIGFGYECFPEGLGYVNIDYFTKFDTENTRVEVTLPAGYSNMNSAVIAVFKDYRVVVNLQGDPDGQVFYNDAFPQEELVEFIVISNVAEDVYHFDSKELTIVADLKLSLDPQLKPLQEIKDYLQSLDD